VNISTASRTQLIEAIKTLPEESLAELSSFVNYLRYKSADTPSQKSGKDFLLSIAGLGQSEESDVSERDEEILAQEINPIGGWSLHTHK